MKKYTLIALTALMCISMPLHYVLAEMQLASGLFTGLIISWEKSPEAEASLWIRTKEYRSGEWTGWYEVRHDDDAYEKEGESVKKKADVTYETLFSTNISSEVEYRIHGSARKAIRNITIEKIFSNREGEKSLFAGIVIPKKLRVISRKQWGADESLTIVKERPPDRVENGDELEEEAEKTQVEEKDPEIKEIVTKDSEGRTLTWALQYAKKIKFIVIHHTASVSNLDNPKTAIQNIAYYHTVKRGWGDIGYNYVIDPQGNIYEGRKGGDGVIGGHALPLNKVSIGIAVLGNYDAKEMPVAAIRSLTALIVQKAKLHKIKINGSKTHKGETYKNIHGHNENTATVCPGKFLRNNIGGMKALVAYHRRQREEEKVPPEKYSFNDFERRTIVAMPPGKKSSLVIRLKNNSNGVWNEKTFLENTGDSSFFPKVIARLDERKKVKPGDIGVFKAMVPETLISGLRVGDARLVVNGSVPLQKAIPMAVHVDGVDLSYEIIERKDPPATMKPGELAEGYIILKNTGNITWKRKGKYPVMIGLSHPIDRSSQFFGQRKRVGTLMQKAVKPGQNAKFIFNFKAPRAAGTYKEYFQPVIEGISWFPDTGLHWAVTVYEDEKPMRIALSFKENEAVLQSATGMKMMTRSSRIRRFKKNQEVKVRLLEDGMYHVLSGKKSLKTSSPPRFVANENGVLELKNFENRPAWNPNLNDNRYRGFLEIRSVDEKLTVINELPIEDYLKGIGEISNDAPKEKIKTIIILARSYASYYRNTARKFPGKPYDLDDDPDHTQKYLGYGFETRAPAVVAAVQETHGKIVTYQGKPVITPYFNQSDGRTRSAQEVWGWTDATYLQSVSDTFCATTELKGHGVGVSGCGATELAKQGKTAEEIIKYYYQGVEITD